MSTGIFAAQDIPENTFVGIYAGEYLTDDVAEERGSYVDISVQSQKLTENHAAYTTALVEHTSLM